MHIDSTNSAVSPLAYTNRYTPVEKPEEDAAAKPAANIASDTIDLSNDAKAYLNELLAIKRGDAIIADYRDPEELEEVDEEGEARAESDESLIRDNKESHAKGNFAQTLEELLALFRPKDADKIIVPGSDNNGALSAGGEAGKTRSSGGPLTAANTGV